MKNKYKYRGGDGEQNHVGWFSSFFSLLFLRRTIALLLMGNIKRDKKEGFDQTM